MKLLKSLALAAILSVGLTACLKDKTAEEVPVDQTMPADGAQDGAATDMPADAGETQSAE